MNKLKSIFVMLMMAGMTVIAVLSITGIFREDFPLGHVGALLTTAPFLGLLVSLLVFKTSARTSHRLPVITALAVLGLVLAVVDYVMRGPVEPLVLALSGTVFFFAYNFWYSELGRRPSAQLQPGKKLPDFTLEDADGNSVRSASFTGTPWILLFYRGNWCPLCMAQIKELAGDYQRLSDLGARVALISPQPHGHTRKLAETFDVDFTFLVDPGNKAADQLEIAAKDGVPLGMGMQGYDADTVLPTVVITDADGTIIFLDETDNYRVRPEPETFIQALKQAGVAAKAV
ncbi:MAG: peroxiredoxin family protein [Alphaproteobacteria bacterium]